MHMGELVVVVGKFALGIAVLDGKLKNDEQWRL